MANIDEDRAWMRRMAAEAEKRRPVVAPATPEEVWAAGMSFGDVPPLDDGQSHAVVAEWSGGRRRVYVDGVLRAVHACTAE